MLDAVLSGCVFLAAAILAFLMLAVCWDVVVRQLGGKPLAWVLEYTEYGLLYITFLGAAWVLKREGHVTLDIVLNQVSKGTRAAMIVANSLLCAAVCMVLTVYSAKVCWEQFVSQSYQPTALETPDFIVYAIIPLGCFLLLAQFLRRAWAHVGILRATRRVGRTAPAGPSSGVEGTN